MGCGCTAAAQLLHGVSLLALDDELRNAYTTQYQQHRAQVESIVKGELRYFCQPETCAVPEYQQLFPSLSDQTMRFLFVNEVYANYEFYRRSMGQLGGDRFSGDHTFAIALTLRHFDEGVQKWVPTFPCVFFLLNEYGMVVHWVFCPNGLFESYEMVFKEMHARDNCHPEEYYCDNCCTVLADVQRMWPGCRVFLDIFHCVCRIRKHLAFGHDLYALATQALKEIFTPAARQLGKQFMWDALHRWAQQDFADLVLNNKKVTSAVDHVLVHVVKGCLDGPNSGTSMNENLHKCLRQLLRHIKRMTSALAQALFTVILHDWDFKKSESQPQSGVKLWRNHFEYNRACALHQTSVLPATSSHFGCFRQEGDARPRADDDESEPFEANESHDLDDGCLQVSTLEALVADFLFANPSGRVIGQTSSTNHILDPIGDGNCLFEAVLQGVRRLVPHATFANNLELRHAAMDTMQADVYHYAEWFPEAMHIDLPRQLDLLRQDGVWTDPDDTNNPYWLGDAMVQALADLLHVGITVDRRPIEDRVELAVPHGGGDPICTSH